MNGKITEKDLYEAIKDIKTNVLPKLNPRRDLKKFERKERVYCEFLDMLVTFTVPIDANPDMHIVVTKSIMEHVNMQPEELLKYAMANVEKNWMMERLDVMLEQFSGLPSERMESPVYVLTATGNTQGASVIISEEIMKAVSDRIGGSVLILPSSIHEVLVMKDPDGSDYENMLLMVRTVNRDVVSDADYLSDNVYVYDNGHFQIITEGLEEEDTKIGFVPITS